ncbi:unnamed protein product [Malus baccata var. baccata]
MDSSRSLLFFVLPSIFNLLAPTLAQFDNRTCTSAAEYCWICSDTAGNYTPGDMYHSNLQRIFSSFSDTRSSSGFYNSSAGQDSNKVNAIALCRGDLALGDCRTCVNESEAILWGERCMVRYSYNVIFGIEQKVPTKFLPGPNLAENAQQFEVVLNPLLGILSEKAASGDSLKKFAAGHATVPNAETIYAFAQCTPDINQQNCRGRVLKPSCDLRYEDGLFFDPSAASSINISDPSAPAGPAPAPKGESNKSNTREIVIIITVVLVAIAIITSSTCIFLRMRKRRVKLLEVEDRENSDQVNLVESLQYDFETIKSATDDFSDANKLGRGGFGAVYKGRLFNGQLIAVKRLANNSQQGDREFKNEVELLAQLQHRNLVRLLGFCLKADERLLIYEYAWRNWMEETPQNIIDPTLTTSSRTETMRCIHIGLLGVQQNVVDRPTVASVVSMFNSHSLTLSVPSRPAFYLQDNDRSDILLTRLTESDESKSSSVYVTQNEPSNITEPYPRYTSHFLVFLLQINFHGPTLIIVSLSFIGLFKLVICSNSIHYIHHFSSLEVNKAQNGPFQDNVNKLLSELSSKSSGTSFFNSTSGHNDKKVYGLYLCRGSVKTSNKKNCTNNRESIVWYEEMHVGIFEPLHLCHRGGASMAISVQCEQSVKQRLV